MNNLVENYNTALQAVYDHVGFTEDWVVYPLDDQTQVFWKIEDGMVGFADTLDDLTNEKGSFCQEVLHKQRFYSKWVYEGDSFTMVFCDSQVDGMKWFRLFDNSKKS